MASISCCSTFHSRSKVSNKEHMSHPKISVKRPLALTTKKYRNKLTLFCNSLVLFFFSFFLEQNTAIESQMMMFNIFPIHDK
jgi:hypothetical protein